MIRFLKTLKFRWRDWLYYSRLPRELAGLAHFLRSMVKRDDASRLDHCVETYRFSTLRIAKEAAQTTLQDRATSPEWRGRRIGWGRYREQLESPALTRTVLLKQPGPDGEKGVLLVTFEYNWLRLLAGVPDLERLSHDYELILSTSSSPTNYHMLALALSSWPGTVFVQVCNYDEVREVETIHPRLRALPMLPCDWIEPRLYEPRPPHQRDIDILMVANWDPVKRHWHFFEALRSMDPGLRVVLVGQRAGDLDIDYAKDTARLFGVPQSLEFHQSLTIEEVATLQCRSKVSAIFSRREGCCVAVTESLFADTPVALVADAHIGPKAYINPRTGVLLDRRQSVGRQFTRFLERWESFDARAWADEHISAEVSTSRLNHFLREHAMSEGRPWNTDLMAPCWRAHPTLRHTPGAEVLRPAYRSLHQRYPDVFPADLFDTSHR